jgi:Zn finger protein HypA/HybF involved in hydrogenase expression
MTPSVVGGITGTAPEPVRYAREIPRQPRVVACHRCRQPFNPKQNPYWCPDCVDSLKTHKDF